MQTRIHIVGGTGQMGTWLKSFFESHGISVTVSGSTGAKKQDVQNADIICFSVPISKAHEIIQKTAEDIKKGALLVDLSSSISKTAEILGKIDNPSVALHLLFGPTVSTVQNQKIIICPIKNVQKIEYLKSLFEKSGANVFEMTISEHEKHMAYVQGLIHFVNIVLGKTLAHHSINLTEISTPVSLAQASALTRVLAQNPELLSEIQLSNPYIPGVLKEFISNSNSVFKNIQNHETQILGEEIQILNRAFTPQRTKKIEQNKSHSDLLLPEEKLKVGYLGPEGTYSYQAAQKVINSTYHSLVPFKTIYDIFRGIADKTVEYGIVPAENSTEGTVRETLDYLVEFEIGSVGMTDLPIHHCLLSYGSDIKKIKKVMSHTQATGQTRKWLETHSPGIPIEHASSTLAAVQEYHDESIAFVGPESAAKKYNLHVLANNIEDNPHNITKFYLVTRKDHALDKQSGKTLLFVTVFNRVGVLRDILQVIASFNINLTNIESRPSHEKVWDYYFFIELDIPTGDPKLAELLNVLKQYCPVINILGSV